MKTNIPFLSFSIIFPIIFRMVSGESPLLLSSTHSSPAFITFDQFNKAINASLPFLPTPLSNSTIEKLPILNQFTYSDFMNYAVSVANITSTDELAMYLSNVLYQSNGLTRNVDPACEDPKSSNCLGLNLNATVLGTSVNYYGRGYLWLQGQSVYTDCAKDMFGNDATLLMYPDIIRKSTTMNWATTSWYWNKFIKPYFSTFGSTIKLLRPSHCNGSSASPTTESQAAWNIYVAILKIIAPTTGPSSSYC